MFFSSLASHTMEDIARIADRIIVLNKGRLELFDTPREVFSDPDRIAEYGLRVPQITRIMQSLRDKGYNFSEGILTVEQAFCEIVDLLKREGKL